LTSSRGPAVKAFKESSASLDHPNGKGGPNQRELFPRKPYTCFSVTIITSVSRRMRYTTSCLTHRTCNRTPRVREGSNPPHCQIESLIENQTGIVADSLRPAAPVFSLPSRSSHVRKTPSGALNLRDACYGGGCACGNIFASDRSLQTFQGSLPSDVHSTLSSLSGHKRRSVRPRCKHLHGELEDGRWPTERACCYWTLRLIATPSGEEYI
jgi:hypothetical protein